MVFVNSFEKLWKYCMDGEIVPGKTRIRYSDEQVEMLVYNIEELSSTNTCAFDHGNEKLYCKQFIIDLDRPGKSDLDWLCVSHYDFSINSLDKEAFGLFIKF
jgi:hypothetical protein